MAGEGQWRLLGIGAPGEEISTAGLVSFEEARVGLAIESFLDHSAPSSSSVRFGWPTDMSSMKPMVMRPNPSGYWSSLAHCANASSMPKQ
jgi:hypothetical protein